MAEVVTVSLKRKHKDWLDENVESPSKFVQRKIEEEMEDE